HHVGRAGGHHEIPQLSGVAAAALVLAGEHADEILEATLLEQPRRLHHDVMAFAADHAPGDQYNSRVAVDAPGVAHRRDTFGRHRGGIEFRVVDARVGDDDALRRHVVALGDQIGDLVAHREHAIAARHHAVVDMLEQVLLAEALVPGGEERHAR